MTGPINHDDYIISLYFFDPNGHRLELTTQLCGEERLAVFEAEAQRILDIWSKSHDWSQREKAFGVASGYDWDKIHDGD